MERKQQRGSTALPSRGPILDCADRQELLRVARRAIETFLDRGQRGEFETERRALLEPGGAFVTLRTDRGELRGCIGTFETSLPLIDTVARMAVAAATSDSRFSSLVAAELPRLRIDISALSPRWQAPADAVVVGEHGIYLSRGAHRGVLLPQVAVESRWDRETFLDHTCRKAGLPAGAWREPETLIEIFTAEVFGEEDGR